MKLQLSGKKISPLSISLILIVTVLWTLSGCQDPNTILVRDSSTSIPIARIGLNGEYDSSGLAKRVSRAFSKDLMLEGRVDNIYVAQNNNKIIIKGSISNQASLRRLVTVANNIRGVMEIDVSQVEVR